MTTFCKTVIPAADYQEQEVKNGRVVVHFGATTTDGMTECAETVVSEGFDYDALESEYLVWAAAQEAQELKAAIRAKQDEINAYDVSDSVNSFALTAGGKTISYWLPRETRNSLTASVGVWKEAHDTYRLDLREYNTSIDIPCETLLQMLAQLEQYAISCYNVTSAHLVAVAGLTTVADVEAYDITAGYPERLAFEIEE